MNPIKGVLITASVILALLVAWAGYGVPYLQKHQTRITEDEIIIGRVVGFASTTTYALNRHSGNEDVKSWTIFPFVHKYMHIEYEKSCTCVVKLYTSDDNGKYYLSRWSKDSAYIDTGIVVKDSRVVPLEQVQSKFDEAKVILGKIRKEYVPIYASVIPQ